MRGREGEPAEVGGGGVEYGLDGAECDFEEAEERVAGDGERDPGGEECAEGWGLERGRGGGGGRGRGRGRGRGGRGGSQGGRAGRKKQDPLRKFGK